MKDIIPPIATKELEQELKNAEFLRTTNYGDNQVFITDYHKTPLIAREIGRLRELSFRTAGGGTGRDCDLDSYDTSDNPYGQLFVWDPAEKMITGGYRYFLCNKTSDSCNDYSNLATAELFSFSKGFIDNYLPRMIELGRSFVPPNLQASGGGARKGVFALDNLWDGLGALAVRNPEISYFFGKVTMYTHFNTEARNMILYYLNKYFSDKEGLLIPFEPLETSTDIKKMEGIFHLDDMKEEMKVLSMNVRELGENMPPLINSYINLSQNLRTFGTTINHGFGGVEETGIMITIKDMNESKVDRHLLSFDPNYKIPVD